MKKKTSAALDILWAEYGPGIQKHAAADYLYRVTKPERDVEALTPQFCKLAAAFEADPWVLADGVAENTDNFAYMAKHASDPRVRELSQFYVNWAQDLEKRAGVRAIKGLWGGVKSLVRRRPKGTSPSPKPIKTAPVDPKALPASKTPVRPEGPAGSTTSSRSGAANLGETAAPVASSRSGAVNVGTVPAGAAPAERAAASARPTPAPTKAPAQSSAPATAPASAPAATPSSVPSAAPAAAPARPPVDWRSALGGAALGGAAVGVPAAAYAAGSGGQAPSPRYY